MRATIFLAVILLLMAGFQKKEMKTQNQMMQEYIDDALAKVRGEEWKKCKQQVVLDAERYVDSIIYQQVNFNIGDTLKAPGKPMKPFKPFDTLRLDTTPIVPILMDSLQ